MLLTWFYLGFLYSIGQKSGPGTASEIELSLILVSSWFNNGNWWTNKLINNSYFESLLTCCMYYYEKPEQVLQTWVLLISMLKTQPLWCILNASFLDKTHVNCLPFTGCWKCNKNTCCYIKLQKLFWNYFPEMVFQSSLVS